MGLVDNKKNVEHHQTHVSIDNDLRVQREQILAKPESGLDPGPLQPGEG